MIVLAGFSLFDIFAFAMRADHAVFPVNPCEKVDSGLLVGKFLHNFRERTFLYCR